MSAPKIESEDTMGNEQCRSKITPRWEIQDYSLCDGSLNAWTDSYPNGDVIPVTFATEEEAEEELREFLEERPDEDESQYCVVSLDEHQCGEIAKITNDGDGGTAFPCGLPAVVVQPLRGKFEGMCAYVCAEHSRLLEKRGTSSRTEDKASIRPPRTRSRRCRDA